MTKPSRILAFVATLGFAGTSSAWSVASTDVWYELLHYEQNALVTSLPFTHVQSNTAPVATTQSIGTASMFASAAPGILKADVRAEADQVPAPYPTPTESHSSARAGANFSDSITLNPTNPALLGQAVTVNASWLVDGELVATWGLLSNLPATASAAVTLDFSGTGVGRYPVQAREQHGYSSGTLYDISVPAPSIIPVSFTASLGTPIGIQYQVVLQGLAAAGFLKEECLTPCSASHASASLFGNFSQSFLWGGISSVTDANGDPIAGFSVSSDSGFDYAVPVPEPQTATMLLAGLVLMGLELRRRSPGLEARRRREE